MPELAKVMKHYQVALPVNIRAKYNIKVGDILEAKAVKSGILLKPKDVIDKSQSYFWTKEWQKGEKQADRDFKAGRFKTFTSVDTFLKDLDK